jgi:hypothetical protein
MSAPIALSALKVGDRIKSLNAGRAGSVAKVYADGSACILWDDGSPQPEGMGHERMPRKLLVLVADDPVADLETALASFDALVSELCELDKTGGAA